MVKKNRYVRGWFVLCICLDLSRKIVFLLCTIVELTRREIVFLNAAEHCSTTVQMERDV